MRRLWSFLAFFSLVGALLVLANPTVAQAVGYGSISGTVTDQSGTPVKDAWVYTTASGEWEGSTVTDSSGSFRFNDLEPGSYWVWGEAPDGSDFEAATKVVVVAGQTTELTFVLGGNDSGEEPSDSGVITGVARDEKGQPIAHSSVFAETASNRAGHVYTDDEGRFSFSGLAEGDYAICIFPSDWGSGWDGDWTGDLPYQCLDERVSLADGQTVALGDVVVRAGGSISGVVRNSLGQPVSGAEVQAYANDGLSWWRGTRTDDAGSFTISGLFGNLSLWAWPQEGGGTCWGESYGEDEDGEIVTTCESIVVGFGQAITLSGDLIVEPDPEETLDLTATPTPTILGSPVVGQNLTVSAGTWAPAPVALEYQWLSNGAAIAGATGTTYTLVAADAGKSITVAVTGSRTGYTTVARTSSPTAAVAAAPVPALTATPTPTVSGSPVVGQTLTATPGVWGPAPVTLSYQWFSGGSLIAGATSASYKPVAADVGKSITVQVTGSKAGYTTAQRTSVGTAAVAATPLPALTTMPTPKISGTVKVGSKLTAKAGTWKPSKVSLAYQWSRGGTPIAGATKSTYTLVGEDAGQAITVAVTGSKSGYTSATKTSKATKKVASGTLKTAAPKISGKAKLGATLTVKVGAWEPAPVGLAYQWYRSGKAIQDATGTSYLLTASDVGKTITVKVSGSKLGYKAASKTSKKTKKVAPGSLSTATPVITGKPKLGEVLTVNPGTWGPEPVGLSYQWYRSGKKISKATGVDYTLTTSDVGKKMTVKVAGKKTGYSTATKTSKPTGKVVR